MNIHDLKNSLHDLNGDQVLSRLGLQSRPSAMERLFSGMALIGTGVVLGVGVGLMVAPRAGNELRRDLRSKLRQASKPVREAVEERNGEIRA